MVLAGVDLAWHSEKNPTAIAFGNLSKDVLTLSAVDLTVKGIDAVFNKLNSVDLQGVSIDAPLIINNETGQRTCETEIGKVYGSRGASCHTSNTKLYPNAMSVNLSKRLLEKGFNHLSRERWQIECYPHPAIIEIFGLSERLQYKKGTVLERKSGQKKLAALLRSLSNSRVLKLSIPDNIKMFFDDHIESLRGQGLKSNEDGLDSVLCLYIAGLYAMSFKGGCKRGRAFGDTKSGYIWVPSGV